MLVSRNLRSTLRSLYRLSEFQRLGSGELMIDHERSILTRRLLLLTPEEMTALVVLYPRYSEEQSVRDAVADLEISKDLEQQLMELN